MASQSGYDDAGRSGCGVSSSKLGPGDLPSKRLLGTGLASVGYETELNGKKCARKDFMGVPSRTFKREAARLVGLEDHINVVKTLGWTENNMSCSLVVEYMDDDLLGFLQKRKQPQGSLEAGPSSGNQSDVDSRNAIKRAPFELPDKLDVMLQIARGMEYLADRGIRHGSLKTKNILVSRTNDRDRNSLSVKVADFGLVRTRRKSTSFASRQARKLDMARWTAPEILQVFLLEDKGETSSESDSDEDCTDSSDVADSDVPEWRELGADVYSFAVICSQILTGEDPYPHLNWKELGVKIVRHGLTPTLPAACPLELRELLVSCWGCDQYSHYLRGRPSFSHICRTLKGLQQMDLPAQYLHEILPLPEKAPMDIKRKGQLWEPVSGKEPTDAVREIGLVEPITVEDMGGPMPEKELTDAVREIGLREPITVEDMGGPMPEKELTDAVREIGLREPITVEDLWGPEFQRVGHLPWLSQAGPNLSMIVQGLPVEVACLIARTRTVKRRRPEWTQLREELELMLPDMLRIRNRMVGCEKALDGDDFFWEMVGLPQLDWLYKLNRVFLDTFIEVKKYQQQEDDRSLMWSLSAALTEPWRVSKLRSDWNQLAKQRKEVMRHLTRALRQAPSMGKREGKRF